MSKKKPRPKAQTPAPPAANPQAAERRVDGRIPVAISVLALIVSTGSMYHSCESRRLAYMVGQPALKAKIELVEAPVAGKKIGVRVLLENKGQTTAKGLYTELGWALAMKDAPLKVEYPAPAETVFPKSDLAPQADTTLTSDESLTLAHDHDVEAIRRIRGGFTSTAGRGIATSTTSSTSSICAVSTVRSSTPTS
jgi:hypothetical protein